MIVNCDFDTDQPKLYAITCYRELQLHGLVIDYGCNDGYAWIPKGCGYLDRNLMLREFRTNSAAIPSTTRVVWGTDQRVYVTICIRTVDW